MTNPMHSLITLAILMTVVSTQAKASEGLSPARATQMQQKIARILSVDSSLVCNVRESSPATKNKFEASQQPVARLVQNSVLAANPGGTWSFERQPKTNNIRVRNYIGDDYGTSGSAGQTGYDNIIQEEFILSADGKNVLKVSTDFSGVVYHYPPKNEAGGYKLETKREIDCGKQ